MAGHRGVPEAVRSDQDFYLSSPHHLFHWPATNRPLAMKQVVKYEVIDEEVESFSLIEKVVVMAA